MPSLSVKSAAELLSLPAFSQVRILTQQKYPKSGSQIFRTPYYSASIMGIRSYFKSDNNISELNKAKNKIKSFSQKSKRENNFRVLQKFEDSDFSNRKFEVVSNPKISASIGTVEFRLSPDLRLTESNHPIILYINCRAVPIDPNIARYTLEIAQWVLESYGEPHPIKDFYYLDLAVDSLINYKSQRTKTLSALQQNAQVINALWPTL